MPGYFWPDVELNDIVGTTSQDGSGINLLANQACSSTSVYGSNYAFSGCQNALDGSAATMFLTARTQAEWGAGTPPFGHFVVGGGTMLGSVALWPRGCCPDRLREG